MSSKFSRSLLLAGGCAVMLSSCDVFKKDAPPPADPYGAASPYAAGAGAPPAPPPGYPANNAYGAPAAADAGASGPGYSAPNYNQPYTQPYTQPATPAMGAGYAGSYDSGSSASSPASAGGSGRTHQVVANDTLSTLAKRYHVTVDSIMRANNLKSTVIQTGKTLIIP